MEEQKLLHIHFRRQTWLDIYFAVMSVECDQKKAKLAADTALDHFDSTFGNLAIDSWEIDV